MASFRLKVKFLKAGDKRNTKHILAALADVCPDVITSDIYPTRGGMMIVIEDTNCLYELLSETTQTKLKEHDLHCPEPNWFNASKTLFVPKARELYTGSTPEELLADINSLNNFKALKVEIIKPLHDPNRRATLKIIMKSKSFSN